MINFNDNSHCYNQKISPSQPLQLPTCYCCCCTSCFHNSTQQSYTLCPWHNWTVLAPNQHHQLYGPQRSKSVSSQLYNHNSHKNAMQKIHNIHHHHYRVTICMLRQPGQASTKMSKNHSRFYYGKRRWMGWRCQVELIRWVAPVTSPPSQYQTQFPTGQMLLFRPTTSMQRIHTSYLKPQLTNVCHELKH